MKLYGAILSPFVCRVALGLGHKGLKYDMVMPEDGLKSPKYLKINPIGKIPSLRDGKLILPESGVILEYLDDKYPNRKKLFPGMPGAAAKVRLICKILEEYVGPATFGLFGQTDPKTRNKKVIKEKKLEVEKSLEWLNKFIGAGPYAAGNTFSAADCYFVPAMFWLHALLPQVGVKDPLAKHKNVKKAWIAVKRNKMVRNTLKDMEKMMKEFRSG